MEKVFRHMEVKRMNKEDRDSDLRGALERKPVVVEQIAVQERIVKVYVEKDATGVPQPLLRAGQSVHQWWAGWMAGCAEAPAGIKGKARPAWFSSSVFAGTALSPSMPRCRNDRNFTRHQLSEMFQGPACRPAC